MIKSDWAMAIVLISAMFGFFGLMIAASINQAAKHMAEETARVEIMKACLKDHAPEECKVISSGSSEE